MITKPELGGAQLSTLDILSGLPRDKYSISVVTSPRGLLKSEFERLTLKEIKPYFSPFLARQINPLLDILALIHIYLIYIRNRFDIIHTHSSKAGIIGRWAARLAGVPFVIHTVHGWSFNEYQNFLKKSFFILLERISAGFTTKIICVSRRDMQTALKYKIAPESKLVFIKYGIEVDKFKRPSNNAGQKKKELGILNDDPVVGMLACLKPQKSPLDYVKACIKIYEKMPNVNFLLVGDGILRTKCEKLLSKSSLDGRFIFTGWRRDIPEILDILDLMILTSKWEGMPITIIEALCKGCPVVATDVGGTRELVKDGITGYLTKPGSYEETAEKALKILKDAERLNNMKKSAVLSIDNSFDIERMVSEVEGVYQALIPGAL